MIWSLSLFLGGTTAAPAWDKHSTAIHTKQISQICIALETYLLLFIFYIGQVKNTAMIGKSRTELPTNAIKATNKTTLNYEIGLWHDYSLGAFYGSLANQKMPHHIHHRNKGLFCSKLKCGFNPPGRPQVLWFTPGNVVQLHDCAHSTGILCDVKEKKNHWQKMLIKAHCLKNFPQRFWMLGFIVAVRMEKALSFRRQIRFFQVWSRSVNFDKARLLEENPLMRCWYLGSGLYVFNLKILLRTQLYGGFNILLDPLQTFQSGKILQTHLKTQCPSLPVVSWICLFS